MGERAALPPPTGQPPLPGSNRRAPDRAAGADPVAMQPLPGPGPHQQLGRPPFDLRPPRLTLADPVNEIVINHEVAAALRELRLLDADCERLVFRIRAHHNGLVLPATDDDLEELIGFVAAEANHESNRRRQQRLDTAFNALSNAAQASGGR